MTLDFNDPLTLVAVCAAVALLILVVLLLVVLKRSGDVSRMALPIAQQMNQLGQRVQMLSDGQQQLAGGLTHVSEAQVASQTRLLELMEKRLTSVTEAMNVNLQGSAQRTAKSLGALQER